MTSRRRTVLMINKYYFIRGGAERYMFELTAVLESIGHRVVPFSMRHPDNFLTSYEAYFLSNIEFDVRNPWRKLRLAFRGAGRILYSFEARRRLGRLIRQTKPDIAHLHMIDHQISPSILHTLKKHGIPVVQTVHQYKLVCPNYLFYIPWRSRICTKCLDRNPLHPLLERCHKKSIPASGLLVLETLLHRLLKMYGRIDRFHVPSRFMGRMLQKGGVPEKKIVHHNYCIQIEDFPQSNIFESEYVYVGRLSAEKGLRTLLHAAADLPDYALTVIGDGPERPKLEAFVRERRLRHVRFTGALRKKEVVWRVSRARFVTVPSEWYENSPLVIYESFALGKPVVGADIGGISELIEPGETGLLFPAGDAERLRECIRTLMADAAKCRTMGKNARLKAESRFSGQAHAPFIVHLYDSLIEKESKRRNMGVP